MTKREEEKLFKQRRKERLMSFIQDEKKLKNIIWRFYRINAMEQRLLIMENTEKYYTNPRLYEFLTDMEDRASKMEYHLNEELHPYDLHLRCENGYAKIVLLDYEHLGCYKEVIFY